MEELSLFHQRILSANKRDAVVARSLTKRTLTNFMINVPPRPQYHLSSSCIQDNTQQSPRIIITPLIRLDDPDLFLTRPVGDSKDAACAALIHSCKYEIESVPPEDKAGINVLRNLSRRDRELRLLKNLKYFNAVTRRKGLSRVQKNKRTSKVLTKKQQPAKAKEKTTATPQTASRVKTPEELPSFLNEATSLEGLSVLSPALLRAYDVTKKRVYEFLMKEIFSNPDRHFGVNRGPFHNLPLAHENIDRKNLLLSLPKTRPESARTFAEKTWSRKPFSRLSMCTGHLKPIPKRRPMSGSVVECTRTTEPSLSLGRSQAASDKTPPLGASQAESAKTQTLAGSAKTQTLAGSAKTQSAKTQTLGSAKTPPLGASQAESAKTQTLGESQAVSASDKSRPSEGSQAESAPDGVKVSEYEHEEDTSVQLSSEHTSDQYCPSGDHVAAVTPIMKPPQKSTSSKKHFLNKARSKHTLPAIRHHRNLHVRDSRKEEILLNIYRKIEADRRDNCHLLLKVSKDAKLTGKGIRARPILKRGSPNSRENARKSGDYDKKVSFDSSTTGDDDVVTRPQAEVAEDESENREKKQEDEEEDEEEEEEQERGQAEQKDEDKMDDMDTEGEPVTEEEGEEEEEEEEALEEAAKKDSAMSVVSKTTSSTSSVKLGKGKGRKRKPRNTSKDKNRVKAKKTPPATAKDQSVPPSPGSRGTPQAQVKRKAAKKVKMSFDGWDIGTVIQPHSMDHLPQERELAVLLLQRTERLSWQNRQMSWSESSTTDFPPEKEKGKSGYGLEEFLVTSQKRTVQDLFCVGNVENILKEAPPRSNMDCPKVYVGDRNIEGLFMDLTSTLVEKQPEDPYEHLEQRLLNNATAISNEKAAMQTIKEAALKKWEDAKLRELAQKTIAEVAAKAAKQVMEEEAADVSNMTKRKSVILDEIIKEPGLTMDSGIEKSELITDSEPSYMVMTPNLEPDL